jgi:hypothetical protein
MLGVAYVECHMKAMNADCTYAECGCAECSYGECRLCLVSTVLSVICAECHM